MIRDPRSPLKKPVGAVVSAIDILRCLGAAPGPLRLSDIVKALKLNASTALNILRTLEREGVVAAQGDSKRYGLAAGLLDLAAPLLDDVAAGRGLLPMM